MGKLVNFVTSLHQATSRDYLARMIDEKVHCMQKAKEYEKDYWDGNRRYGYGGYKYLPGRWKPVALDIIKHYSLKKGDKILELKIPNIKKIKETTKDQTLISPLFNRGYKEINRKTIEKTIPKLRFEPTLISFM